MKPIIEINSKIVTIFLFSKSLINTIFTVLLIPAILVVVLEKPVSFYCVHAADIILFKLISSVFLFL